MNCSETKHVFYLHFHTLWADQVLFPIFSDYIFHNTSSITFPLAQGRQAYCTASSYHMWSPPGDLDFELFLGLPDFSNHSSRDVSLLTSQGWPSLCLTHLFGGPGAAPPILSLSWCIMALPNSTSFFLYICVCKGSTCGNSPPTLQLFQPSPSSSMEFFSCLNFLIYWTLFRSWNGKIYTL